jgi:RHS repeat-associated protein
MTPGLGHRVSLASDGGDGSVIADAPSAKADLRRGAFEPVNAAPNKAIFRPIIAAAGEYSVWAQWASHNDSNMNPASFATAVPYTIHHAGGSTVIDVDQSVDRRTWKFLGNFNFAPGMDHRVEIQDKLLTGEFIDGLLSADVIVIESTSSPGNVARWEPAIPHADTYDISVWLPSNMPGATNARYIVTHAGGVSLATLDQNKPAQGWLALGAYDLTPGAGHKVELSDRLADGRVVADYFRITQKRMPERKAIWQGIVATPGDYRILARWPSLPGLANNAKYSITLPGGVSSVVMNQSADGGTWRLLKSVTLAANDNWKVELSDQASGPVAADAIAIVPAAALGAFTWAPTLPSAGTYQIFAKWPGGVPGLASDALYSVAHSGGVTDVTLSQKQGGSTWRYLGAWALDPALAPSVTLKGSLGGTVAADALRFVRQPTSGGVSYILSDQVGQPQKMLDGAGALSWDRIATPFGETAMALGSATANALRFPGQQYDALTGLHYNYFRDYDPSLGRYPQSDPIGLAGGLNTYAYVGGNPVSRVDPTGEVAPLVILGVIWGLTELGLTAYDVYDAGRTLLDECAAPEDKALSLGGLAMGALLPGGGYGAGAKAVKVVAQNGTEVTGLTRHGVNMAIGDGAARAGVKPQAALDALKNPSRIVKGVDNQGRPSEVFYGKNARVVVNPVTGKIVSMNPLSGAGAKMNVPR